MLLAVDIGNTQTVIGLFSESDLVSSWRIVTDVRSTTDELLIKLRALLDYRSYDSASLDSFVLASVVPALTSHWYDLASDMGLETMVIGSGTQTELKLSSDLHREVGADRLADCVGALSLYGAPCIIVDLGTATNMEVIDREGTFLGGIIAPGFVMHHRDRQLQRIQQPNHPQHTVGARKKGTRLRRRRLCFRRSHPVRVSQVQTS